MNVLVTLNQGIGAGLGPDFLVTSNIGGWSDIVTEQELYDGVVVTPPDNSDWIYIQSLGLCLNILTIPVEDLPDCDLAGTATEVTTTTSTSTSTTTSTTTTTTTQFPCNLNYSIDEFEVKSGEITTTTTTTIEEETTTTTTTTQQQITTTTTTTVSSGCEILDIANSKIIFEETLPFTPNAYYGGYSLVEDSDYIFFACSDSYINPAQYTTIYRYKKSDGTTAYKRVMTTNGYYGDAHKQPSAFITSAGTLLVAVEQLPSSGSHNSPIQVFRWTDTSDLDTYTSTSFGSSLAYPHIYEYNNEIIIDCRKYGPDLRTFGKSSDDGQSFTTFDYANFSDSNWWLYISEPRNIVKGQQPQILQFNPLLGTYIAYKYVSLIKTDFTNFYGLDGTSYGTSLTKVEVEAELITGNTTINDSNSKIQTSKIFDGYLYTVTFIGNGNWSTTTFPNIRIVRTDILTGEVVTGGLISNPLSNTLIAMELLNIDNEIYIQAMKNTTIYYYRVAFDLNSIELKCTETGSSFNGQASDRYSELIGVWFQSTNRFRVSRFSNPDDVVYDYTTTTTSTSTSTTTSTTTAAPLTTLKTGLASLWELNETSGTTVNATHGAVNGTNSSATVNQSGLSNLTPCYDFNANAAISFGNTFNYGRTSPFSFSMWVNRETNSNIHVILSNQLAATPFRGYLVYLDATTGYITWQLVSTNTTNLANVKTTSVGITSASGWTHLVCTYDGSSTAAGLKVYVNSSAAATTTLNDSLSQTTITTDTLYLGARVNTFYFDGKIDQFGIWTKALSQTEINTLYNSGNGLAYTSW